LITALFGLPWALTAAGLLQAEAATGLRLAALTITVLAIGVALLPPATGQDRVRLVPTDWRRRFNQVGLAQAAAILAVGAALVLSGRPTLIPAAVCLVVGLHFLPLARLFDQPQFRWTGAGMCLVAAVAGSLHLWGPGTAAEVVAGGGAAVVLWVTSLHVARVD
jgi:hypothetical protein